MAINVKDYLTILNKQSLNTLTSNIDINFLSVKNKIHLYCNSSDMSITSLMDLFNMDFKIMSSPTINAATLLLYLDFYAAYISLYSTYTNYKGLVDVSKNKYIYINNLVNELKFNISEKEESKKNKYVSYADFINLNMFNIYTYDILSRTGSSLSILNSDKTLSLPINKSKEHYPSSIIALWNNSTESFSENISFNKDTLYYNLYRLDSDYIGVISSIREATTSNVSKSIKLNTDGVLTDIDLNQIYIKVVFVESTYETVKVVCSSNAEEWSSEIEVYTNIDYNLLIEDDIDTGITFNLTIDTSIKENDTWILDVKRVQLPYPDVQFKMQFNNFDNISMLTVNDISDYELEVKDATIKKKKNGDTSVDIFKKDSLLIGFPNTSIDEYKVKYEQKDSDFYNYNGKVSYNYTYYLTDIKAIVNSYNSSGAISFNNIDVEEINNIQIKSTEYIYKEDNLYPKMFIEYNVYTEIDLDKVLIPALPIDTKYQTELYEYLIPESSEETSVLYKTRFPCDNTSNLYLVNLTDRTTIEIKPTGQSLIATYSLESNNIATINILDFDSKKQFAIKYKPKIYNASDTYNLSDTSKWIKSNKLYYMYYKDKSGYTRIGLKTENSSGDIIPITGTVSSYIEMRSLEISNLSPHIINYYMICN
jgi:hypothetical protein